MTPVWDVAPHPEATDREGPGKFREHDIHPFAEGMTPCPQPGAGAARGSGRTDFSLTALRRAAQRGRLDAVQGLDGIWRSSRKAGNAYRGALAAGEYCTLRDHQSLSLLTRQYRQSLIAP